MEVSRKCLRIYIQEVSRKCLGHVLEFKSRKCLGHVYLITLENLQKYTHLSYWESAGSVGLAPTLSQGSYMYPRLRTCFITYGDYLKAVSQPELLI